VQAICDANMRFLYVCVSAPGKTNDNRAFKRLDALHDWLDELLDAFYLVGDNAYTLTRKLLIPFSGAQKFQPDNRTYNFFLSQLRIRIEMAFGLLCTKWRIFHSNLDSKFGLEFQSDIIQAACRLHNFVLDEEKQTFKITDSNMDLNQICIERFPNGAAGNRGYLRIPLDEEDRDTSNPEHTARRDEILQGIASAKLTRPQHNRDRNAGYDSNDDIDSNDD